MGRTPALPGPFCHMRSPGENSFSLLQNWHLWDQASWHMCRSVKPGKGFGGLVGRALRAEAHNDSDFRRDRRPGPDFEVEASRTSARRVRKDRLTWVNRPRSASEQKEKTCCHSSGGSVAGRPARGADGAGDASSLRFFCSSGTGKTGALRLVADVASGDDAGLDMAP